MGRNVDFRTETWKTLQIGSLQLSSHHSTHMRPLVITYIPLLLNLRSKYLFPLTFSIAASAIDLLSPSVLQKKLSCGKMRLLQ